jgi:basic amino acid/polyamine antiporter, APA family
MLAMAANSGILGASRLTLAMHPMDKPLRAVLPFSLLGVLLVVVAAFTRDSLATLANLYIFGATLGYLLLFVSLIKLRTTDPWSPRPYKLPINLPWKRKDGTIVSIPILALLGLGGVGTIFLIVALTHRVGRIAGAVWMALGLAWYLYHRGKRKQPLLGSVERDWEAQHLEVLRSADETDLVEQYRHALHQRDKKR